MLTKMLTYTIFSSDHPSEHRTGFPLELAAGCLLSQDGHRWDIMSSLGEFTIWRSQSSVRRSGGPGPMIQQAPFWRFNSKEAALLWVVSQEWKGLEALTDHDFAEAHLRGDCSQCGVKVAWTSEQLRDGDGPWDSHDGDVCCDDCWAKEEIVDTPRGQRLVPAEPR
tara:strand:+ start:605 stop:1102 length:498 start_codon:yes stop_codon:yes gene_type:complete